MEITLGGWFYSEILVIQSKNYGGERDHEGFENLY